MAGIKPSSKVDGMKRILAKRAVSREEAGYRNRSTIAAKLSLPNPDDFTEDSIMTS